MGIKTVPHPPYSPDLAPCDFCLFPKPTGCRYETIEEMKEVMTKVIDTLTQEDFDGAFQKLLERYKCIAAAGDYFEGEYSFMYVLSIKVPIRKQSRNLFNDPRNCSDSSRNCLLRFFFWPLFLKSLYSISVFTWLLFFDLLRQFVPKNIFLDLEKNPID